MAGRRLLDAVTLAAATRAVARQHVRIRQEQFDVWSQTSSIARAAKDQSDSVARGVQDQTDRVTLTAKAAGALIARLNENGPEARRVRAADRKHANDSVRSGFQGVGTRKDEPESERHGKISEDKEGSLSPKAAKDEVAGQSEKTDTYISQPKASTSGGDAETQATLNPEQQFKAQAVPQQRSGRPPEAQHGESASNEYDDVPEGVNIDVFQNPRVKKLLGTRKASATQPSFQQQYSSRQKDVHRLLHEDENSAEREKKPGSLGPLRPEESQSSKEGLQDLTESADDTNSLAFNIAQEAERSSVLGPEIPTPEAAGNASLASGQMHESRVPSSRVGRLWQYSGLATSMALGAVGESLRRVTGSGNSAGSLMLNSGNMERLVAKLSRMRGAALKLGQMMSFQDSKMLPAPIHEVLQRVQDNADYMPAWQRNRVLTSNLGDDWQSLFSKFDDTPVAAASVGQVHKATLASNHTQVAVKIQYPGVATSITSDLNNLSILLTASRLLPKGLFLDKTIANARAELAWECDYLREASCQTRFRELLADETNIFTVPTVFTEASGPQVLIAEFMSGTAVTKSALALTQAQKDWIGTNILRLCLRELTEFNFMQTDPNWTNFLFNKSSGKLELLDFGAAREFPERFVDPYVRTLTAAAAGDRAAVRDFSIQLGYLTGKESKNMRDAHVDSVMTLAEPFKESNALDAVYDFRDQTITDRVRALIPVMIRERLAPPPEETYSLHRKLSGAFLLLARLGSRVRCREMFVKAIDGWNARKGESGE